VLSRLVVFVVGAALVTAEENCWCTAPGTELTGAARVVTGADGPAGPAGPAGAEEAAAAVIGQIVVYSEMISVVTWPILAGQFVTSGAQDVIV